MESNIKLNQIPSMDETDEDLESLRLAALKSIKKKSQPPQQQQQQQTNHFSGTMRGKNKRGRFFPTLNQGRSVRNNQFNNWVRNSNLISIPTVASDESTTSNTTKSITSLTSDDVPKLILPQDRYSTTTTTSNKTDSIDEPVSKFDRYDNSDESDSESDDIIDIKSPTSIEAIMAELENEIQGDGGNNKTKKLPKQSSNENANDKKLICNNSSGSGNNNSSVVEGGNVAKENLKPENSPIKRTSNNYVNNNNNNKRMGFGQRKWPKMIGNNRLNLNKFISQPIHNNNNQFIPHGNDLYLQSFPQQQQQQYNSQLLFNNNNNAIYQNQTIHMPPLPPLPLIQQQQLINFDSTCTNTTTTTPLSINTNDLTSHVTTTLAPLSPRSAAFVLENRAIIEKRKRSSPLPPSRLRSYSRSPSSPRLRRSRSPLIQQKRSLSPTSQRSLIIKKHSSNSPLRRNQNNTVIQKSSVHERLGLKLTNSNNNNNNKVEEKQNEILDPVLEARRKKFENNKEISVKAGVIRLKTMNKDEDNINKKLIENDKRNLKLLNDDDELTENHLLDDSNNDDNDETIEIETKIDLFSDDESNSDNEGRFKAKTQTLNQIKTLPFTKLIDDDNNKKLKSLKDYNKNNNNNNTKRRLEKTSNSRSSSGSSSNNNNRRRLVKRSRSPIKLLETNNKQLKSIENKKHVNIKPSSSSSSSTTKKRVCNLRDSFTLPIDNKKIEIKIRNPSKYEKTINTVESLNDEKLNKIVDINHRRVEVSKDDEQLLRGTTTSDDEGDVDNYSDGEVVENINEGDLRAQLSRKRAERQKHPILDGVPSRLLQNALKGAVFKKCSKEKEVNLDGKLPIHLRLGAANSTLTSNSNEVFNIKSRKHNKKRACLEQV